LGKITEIPEKLPGYDSPISINGSIYPSTPIASSSAATVEMLARV
jgi:hypothetical protein